MTHKDYKHIFPIQIRFCDIDKLNHVNNACYHSYIELGRVKYFDQLLKGHINWDEQGFVLARTELDHVISLHLNDDIYCCTKVTKFGTKSLTIKNCIVKKVNDELIECASGIGIWVAMDYVNNVTISIPQQWRELIEAFENN